ncbi:MAG: putative sugar O-methyltransferase [Hyphomicrobiaceae bacterium]
MTKEQRALLHRMMDDNRISAPPFTPSPMLWNWLNANLIRQMHLDGVDAPENSLMNHWFSAQLPGHKKYYFYAVWNLYCRLKERDRYGVLEKVEPSADSERGVCIDIAGKKLSWDYLNSAMSVMTIADFDSSYLTERRVVLEIGAGWGRLAHFLHAVNPSITYIIADIPGALLVAESYLTKLFPRSNRVRYDEIRRLDPINLRGFESGFVFLGTHHLPKVADQSVDLLINTSSFQEMEKRNVALYMAEARRIARTCYLLQRTKADEVGREDYIEMASSVGWSVKLERAPEFAPLYAEMILG